MLCGVLIGILGAGTVAAESVAALDPLPASPGEKDWQFVQELQQPCHRKVCWLPRSAKVDEVDFSGGLTVERQFADPLDRLDTVYEDLDSFFGAVGIKSGGAFKLITEQISTSVPETYRVVVTNDQCRVQAGDTEGIRRGLYFLEDRILSAGGPFLTLGTVTRTPVIRSRIARCFFGPIKRPPKNRDELMDDVNYYPEPYLNRLAHEGINGLWLTISFEDLCQTRVVPEYGKDAGRRLAKLRETVRRCLRYGIKTYVFCIEPAAFDPNSPVLAAHPELGGHRCRECVYFCPSSTLGQEYLREATASLFSNVPGLGGLVDISVGERATICPNAGMENNNCPRCSKRKPWDIMHDCLAAMARGMHEVDPSAELISWFYIPNDGTASEWGEEALRTAAEHIPAGVALQHNFESDGGEMQLGKWRQADDYWLSYIGPSPRFIECAKRAARNGTRMFAKLQVGCSHEVASVPFVPVPGNLYQKYRAMHELGVSGVMQCWYFGSYPGLMNRAAGELAFSPLPSSQEQFLLELARRDWGADAAQVVRAWNCFSEAYSNYPLNTIFSYCGPMANGVAWPLYLKPRDLPLEPTWQLQYPASGDRIGECVTSAHTLQEALTLCQLMARGWNQGVELLRPLRPKYSDDTERLKDIGLAEALGIQFQSGADILEFYALREKLAWGRGKERLETLERMKALVKLELALDAKLLPLSQADSRLGFHSEAEGYKYFPERIRWRMQQLDRLLATEFPEIEQRLRQGLAAFPEYIGQEPGQWHYDCPKFAQAMILGSPCTEGAWAGLPSQPLFTHAAGDANGGRQASWRAGYDSEALYVGVVCRVPHTQAANGLGNSRAGWEPESVEIQLEPKRLWPAHHFQVDSKGLRTHHLIGGRGSCDWQAAVVQDGENRSFQFRFPFASLDLKAGDLHPIRLNVILHCSGIDSAWMEQHPIDRAYPYEGENPADLGWLRFATDPSR
jgi:hypothetical protein